MWYPVFFFFLMIRRPPSSTLSSSSAASDVYKRQSLSWNALESLVVGMSHEVPARALALALDDAQERLLQEACGPRWAPVRGLLAPFAFPGCGAREDFARKTPHGSK